MGRFLAIAGIVALGCGFYAGLNMTGTDMRIAADAFYDGTSLYDLRVLSSLGYTDEQVSDIADTEGVEAVMPTCSTDVMASLDDSQYTIRVNSFEPQDAQRSSCSDGRNVVSDDDSYMNRMVLEEGRWPESSGECVLSADRVMSTPIKLGDTVKVLYGSKDLDGVLETREYTVVGLVHSSMYVSDISMGSTSMGSGSIDQYMYVPRSDFSQDCPYTEVYVKVEGAIGLFSGSDAYQAKVDEVAERLKGKSSELAESRLSQVKSDAQNTLDESTADYEKQRTDAMAQLDEAATKLDDALTTLQESQAAIDDAQSQLDAGVAELASGRAEAKSLLSAAYDKLVAAQVEADSTTTLLEQNQTQLDAGYAEYQQGLSQWQQQSDTWNNTTRPDLEQKLTDAQQSLTAAELQRESIEAQMKVLDPDSQEYKALEEQLKGIKAQIKQIEEGIAGLQAGIAEGDAAIADGKAALDASKQVLDESRQQLDAAFAQLQAGKEELVTGWSSYYSQSASTQAQLDDSQAQIDSSAAQLADARTQLEKGQQEYSDGKAEYDTSRIDTLNKLSDAAEVLASAQQDINSIASPDIYVLDRTKNYGVTSLKADSERIDNIAAVFPFIFFLVAALVALTTMTRMVDEDRVLIGTFKALGYSKSRITGKYIIYAGVASASGAIIGILVLSQVLPYVVSMAYAIIYNTPQMPLPLAIDMPVALLSFSMGVGITLFATWAAVAATLREEPAALMLPRAPRAGKRILMERITPLWRHMSFSWKVTVRNLFRYKKRFFMTIIGIAGCTALLLTGLGLHDAIWDIIDNQYGRIIHYNVSVSLKDDATEEDMAQVEDYMRNQGDTTTMARAQRENMQLSANGKNSRSVELVVPQDDDVFQQMITMQVRTTGRDIDLNDNSVILTEKMANLMGAGAGDTVTIYEQDEIGNAVGDGYQLTVTDVMENYTGSFLYMGKNAYANSVNGNLAYMSIYGDCTDESEKRTMFTEGMHEIDSVETVTYNDETIDSYRKMLSSVNMIVVVLVAAAATLAFIVLYNLTNINITERRREIASLKVLGFLPREVDAYIFREIVLLTLIGDVLGLVFGVLMEGFVVVTAEVDYVMFGRVIHTMSFVWAFLLTMVFLGVVMLFMKRKLDGVDMIESLKSIE